jgi:hypothetical protein
MIILGNASIEISLIAVFLAVLAVKLLPIIIVIWFVVQGFRVHWGWGVANLLMPVAIIPFCILHPQESKRPLILLGVCLGTFLILWACARHGSYARPRVELTPDLPASATNAVLYLSLAASADTLSNHWTQTVTTISGSLSRKRPVMPGGHSNGRYDEERLIAIRADGFMIQFTKRAGREMRTNYVLFPYGRTTETNAVGWDIVGSYDDNMRSRPAPEPTTGGAFRLY